MADFKRREFLRNGLVSLALPFLPSMFPRKTWAAEPGNGNFFRLMCIQTGNGQWEETFMPSGGFYNTGNMKLVATEDKPGGQLKVYARDLSEIVGSISQVLSPLNNYKTQATIFKNVTIGAGHGHGGHIFNGCGGIENDCTSKVAKPPHWGYSLDQVVARSTILYPESYPRSLRSIAVRDRQLCTDTDFPYISWYEGKPVSAKGSSGDLWNNLLASPFANQSGTVLGGSNPAPQIPVDSKVAALNAVFEDYKALRSPRRNIASQDLQTLEAYMTLLNEAAKEYDVGVKNPPPPTDTSGVKVSCQQPAQNEINSAGANETTEWDMKYKLIAASFICGVCKVASANSGAGGNGGDSGYHNNSHLPKDQGGPSKTLPFHQWNSQRVRVLLDALNSVKDANGRTVLDNSLVLWGNDIGFDSPGGHSPYNMPLVSFGSLGGRLRSNKMLVFNTNLAGASTIAMSSVLQTVFEAMGISYPTQVMRTYGGVQVKGFGPGMNHFNDKLSHWMSGALPYWKV